MANAASAQAAVESFGGETLAALQTETRPPAMPFEVNTRILPTLHGATDAASAQRSLADMPYNTTQHIDVTGWLTPDTHSRFGWTLGLSTPAASLLSPATMGGAAGSLPAPQLDLGLRWRAPLQRGRHLDVSAWAQAPDAMGQIWQTQPASYGTRVEVQWASSRTRGLMPEFGAIGMQLQGGSRLVLRARKGGPMLYYRAKF